MTHIRSTPLRSVCRPNGVSAVAHDDPFPTCTSLLRHPLMRRHRLAQMLRKRNELRMIAGPCAVVAAARLDLRQWVPHSRHFGVSGAWGFASEARSALG